MKTLKTLLYAAIPLTLACLTLAGCQKDNDTVSLKVEIDNFTNTDKTFIDTELYTCWSNGDRVRINNVDYTLYLNGHSCSIHNVAISNEGYTALSPAGLATAQTSMSGSSITNLQLPSTYTYSPNEVPVVMAAHLSTATGTINFKNACMVMMLNITNNYSHNLRISNVKISDSHAPLSGTFLINHIDTDAPTLAAAIGNTACEVMLQMTATEPVELQPNQTTTVYAVLPPTNDYPNNKFTIEIDALDLEAAANGTVVIYHFNHRQASNANGAIPRNTLVPIDIQLDDPHTTTLDGLGPASNPYKISSLDNLIAMEQLVNRGYDPIGLGEPFASAHYEQIEDIYVPYNYDDYPLVLHPIGNAENHFTGTYDGGGYRISNAYISGDECVGLFGYISNGAVIKHLAIYFISIAATNNNYAILGSVCGQADHATIDRCYITGGMGVSCNAECAYIGGLVGEMTAKPTGRCRMTNCLTDGNSIGLPNGNTMYYTGGIVGHIMNSTVINTCDLTFYPSANSCYFGGIVGRADGNSTIINCYRGYTCGSITGTEGMIADICAWVGNQCCISHCYYHDNLYATGNPTLQNLENNMQYVSYRNATGHATSGLVTLKDYLQRYVNTHNSDTYNDPLCNWDYYNDEYTPEDEESLWNAPHLDIYWTSF